MNSFHVAERIKRTVLETPPGTVLVTPPGTVLVTPPGTVLVTPPGHSCKDGNASVIIVPLMSDQVYIRYNVNYFLLDYFQLWFLYKSDVQNIYCIYTGIIYKSRKTTISSLLLIR